MVCNLSLQSDLQRFYIAVSSISSNAFHGTLMSQLSNLSASQKQELIKSITRTKKLGLLPTGLAVGHCLVLYFTGVENMGVHGAIGWVVSLLFSILVSLTVVIVAVSKQKKLAKKLAASIGCDVKELLREARG